LVLRNPQTNEDTEAELIGSFIYRNWQVFIVDVPSSVETLSPILLAYLEKCVVETPIFNLTPGKAVFAIFLHDPDATHQSECATILEFPLSVVEPVKISSQQGNEEILNHLNKVNENRQKKRKAESTESQAKKEEVVKSASRQAQLLLPTQNTYTPTKEMQTHRLMVDCYSNGEDKLKSIVLERD